MPKSERVIKVFVAAPEDVNREITILKKIIDQLNLHHGSHLGVRLRVINWKTDVIPSAGVDPQSVINDQIGCDYDVFIGVLWTRFGISTPRAASGTEEEFQRAYSRWQSDLDCVRIMMYFSNVAVPPNAIDFKQLAKVYEFCSSIQDRTIYCKIDTRKEFEDFARRHLAAIMHASAKKGGKRKSLRAPREGTTRAILTKVVVPFNQLQNADFIGRTISSTIKGFNLAIDAPTQPYWRAGFVLAPDDYISEGRDDISIKKYLLFHVGRGEPSDPKRRMGLHYHAYYKDRQITSRMPFESGNPIQLKVAFKNERNGLTVDLGVSSVQMDVDPSYFKYLYVLAWADWLDEFRVPVVLKIF